MVIFDTNILIELYRGNAEVADIVQDIHSNIFYISAITAAEFLAGAKDKNDLAKIEKQLSKYVVIPLNIEITEIFLDLFKAHMLSRRPGIPGTLIAATALYHNLPIYTLNKKHFQFIESLQLI
jgi:predicted nucleic acid-binding protein